MTMTLCKILLRTRWLPGIQHHALQKFREIYSPVSLGITDYQNVRDRYKNLNPIALQAFRQKMEETNADASNTNLVFSDDLKQMIHMVENDDDLKLLEGLLSKFNKQNGRLRFDKFVFGTVIMRMYYHMNRPVEAFRAYKNPELENLFDQLSTHVLLLDLLFKSKMYDEVIEVYKTTREKQLTFGKYAKTLLAPVFGALYKLNTAASCEYMVELLQEMHEAGHVPIRRAICFCAALAVKQNNPQLALELLSSVTSPHFVLVRSIKAIATCSLNQIDETLIILASVLSLDSPVGFQKHTFPEDVVTTVKNHIEKSGRKDHIIEFRRIEKELIHYGRISSEALDDLLCDDCVVYNPVNKMKTVISASIDNTKSHKKVKRPGLLDML